MTVTYAGGFRASGVSAGLRSERTQPDLAMVVNDGPLYTAAAVFTANRVQAAPVRYSRQAVADGQLKAVVLNAGGANACTGPAGYRDTVATGQKAGKLLDVAPTDVAICSTGLIGERLPLEQVLAGLNEAVEQLNLEGGVEAAAAILTTDTHPKTETLQADGYRIGAMIKGAGMLAPSLATMLCVITTDAVLDPELADKALREACAQTFDRIDADGCMSTNDTVLLLASGASGVAPSPGEFADQLATVSARLSRQLLADAEGASKEVAITIIEAASTSDAVEVGRSIARNNLLKCALFGNDPNWGRVLAAIGTTAAEFDPDQLDVAMNDVWVCRAGAAAASRSDVDISGREVRIMVNLHAGSAQATVFTNDLSLVYVHENSAYSS